MSLFQELKRRNVVRVAIGYIVMAWLVMQVADVVLNNIEAPGWVFKAILLVLGIGFVVAVFFAWEFEMTPEGLKRENEVDRSQSITTQTGRKLDFVIIGILVLALGYFAYDKFVLPESPTQATTQSAESSGVNDAQPTEPDRSIAVLPFADMSPDGDQEYFSDGLSEELLNLLAKIPELRVAARTSAWSYKGKDIKIDQVARELGVAHVLEGSVRTAGNRIRVTAQLIKSDDGFHLWSETYDRTLDDVFAIQDEISGAVVEALKVTLLGEAPQVQEISQEAYALFLQARHLSNQLLHENYPKAVSLYQQVLELEPGYAPAWIGISRNYRNMGVDGQLDETQGFEMAVDAADKALQLNPNLAEAHARRGSLYLGFEQKPLLAAEHYRKAMSLNPNDPAALQGVADFASMQGMFDKAIALGEAAVLRDPVDAVLRIHLGRFYMAAGRTEEAIDIFGAALNLSPGVSAGHYHMGSAYLTNGDYQAALTEFELDSDIEYVLKGQTLSYYSMGQMEEFKTAFTGLQDQYGEQWPSEIAHVYAWTGDKDSAFDWLDKAVAMNEGGIGTSREIWWLKPLHDDPRWQAYLEKLGISDEQVAEIEFEF